MDRRTFTKALSATPILVTGGLLAGEVAKDARLIELGQRLSPLELTYHEKNMELDAMCEAGSISIDEADRRYDVIYQQIHKIVAQIEKETPETIEGMQVMARAIRWCHSGKIDMDAESTDMRLTMSILNALTKQVAA